MMEFLILFGQCLCVVGIIYAALLATVRLDWLENLPADSLECDAPGRHEITPGTAENPARRCLRRQ